MRGKLKFFVVFSLLIFISSPGKIKAAEINLKLPFPTKEKWKVTQGYNGDGWDTPNKLPTHRAGTKDQYALDFSLPGEEDRGKAILAAADGIALVKVQLDGTKKNFIGYGQYVDINHGNGLITRYAHLLSFSIKDGDYVHQGQEIGRADNTGSSSGSHLHFAMYQEADESRTDASGRTYVVKVLKPYKPEPMSGYTNFLAGNWYESDNALAVAPAPAAAASGNTGTVNQIFSFFYNLYSTVKTEVLALTNNITQGSNALTQILQGDTASQPTASVPEPVVYSLELVSQSGNDTLLPGETATLWAKFKNTGNQAWQKNNVSLNIDITKNSEAMFFYNSAWATSRRPAVLDQDEVKPGEIGSFTFQVTAPTEEKIYNPYFRPVYSDATGFHWLGNDANLHWTITIQQEKALDQGGMAPEPIVAPTPTITNPLPTETTTPEILPLPVPPIVPIVEPVPAPVEPVTTPPAPPEPPASLLDPPYVPPIRYPPDTTPPDTIIDSQPNDPTSLNNATLVFHSTEASSTFECDLDSVGFLSCVSPFSMSNLAEGAHTFAVRAKDQIGNTDLTPASSAWNIDTTPPASAVLALTSLLGSNTYTKDQNINLAITNDSEVWAWLVSETQNTLPTIDDPNWVTARPTNFVLSVGDGTKTIYLWTKDVLDNFTPTATTAMITFDTTAPASQVSSLNNPMSSLIFSVSWLGSDAGSGVKTYDIQYRDGLAGVWQDWQLATTAVSADFTGTEEHAYYFRSRAIDNLDNAEDWPTDSNGDVLTTISFSRQVVISEVAWMGTVASANDEWIELMNTTSSAVNLAGWTLQAADGTPSIALTGTINPYGYYLLERTADTTINNITADQIYTGALGNAGEDLELLDTSGRLVDALGALTAGAWPAGDNTTKATMERIDPAISGNVLTNWKTNDGITISGRDAANNLIKGTPKKPNHAITTLASLTQDTTLQAKDSPFRLFGAVTVPAGITLTIEPGVVIKANLNGILSINGTLIISGASEKKVVFTSEKDDYYVGDTNGDGTTTSPAIGDWPWIILNAGSQNSTINNALVRYGGYYWLLGKNDGEIRVEDSAVDISNTTIDYGMNIGIHLVNAGASNITNCLIEHQASGIVINGGAPTISNCQIKNNNFALGISNNSLAQISNNQFIDNNNVNFVDEAPVSVSNAFPIFENNEATGNDFNGVSISWSNDIIEDYTLKADLPYLSSSSISVAVGKTLTIEPGVVIKNEKSGIWEINGTLLAQGTAEKPVVFTSLKDDAYGGDTNNNGSATVPATNAWPWIIFTATSQNSIIDNAIVRYGGYYWLTGTSDGEIRVEDSDATITNTTIDYGAVGGIGSGVHTKNSNSVINNSIIQNQKIGWKIEGGSPTSDNSQFLNNNIGILSTTGSTPNITNYIFNGNTMDTSPADLLP